MTLLHPGNTCSSSQGKRACKLAAFNSNPVPSLAICAISAVSADTMVCMSPLGCRCQNFDRVPSSKCQCAVLFAAAGWILFLVFAGWGIFAAPIDWIFQYIRRPKSVITKSEYIERARGLAQRAKEIKVRQHMCAAYESCCMSSCELVMSPGPLTAADHSTECKAVDACMHAYVFYRGSAADMCTVLAPACTNTPIHTV